MIDVLVAFSFAFLFIPLLYLGYKERQDAMNKEAALAAALDLGVSLEKNGLHLYKRGKGYRLLNFKNNPNVPEEVDYVDTERDKAVAFFVEAANVT